jgi:hypothetical protein
LLSVIGLSPLHAVAVACVEAPNTSTVQLDPLAKSLPAAAAAPPLLSARRISADVVLSLEL